jgi:hypothetical protein
MTKGMRRVAVTLDCVKCPSKLGCCGAEEPYGTKLQRKHGNAAA